MYTYHTQNDAYTRIRTHLCMYRYVYKYIQRCAYIFILLSLNLIYALRCFFLSYMFKSRQKYKDTNILSIYIFTLWEGVSLFMSHTRACVVPVPVRIALSAIRTKIYIYMYVGLRSAKRQATSILHAHVCKVRSQYQVFKFIYIFILQVSSK